MKKLFAAFALVALSLLPARAIAQASHDHLYASPKTTVNVSQALVVGTTTLKPGDYKFQCRTFGDQTFLVITNADTGKEIVRVPCVRETLDGVVTETEFRTLARADGQRILVNVRIKGESVVHNLVID